MQPNLRIRNREAAGLPEDLAAFFQTAQEVHALMASGVNADGSLTPAAMKALLKFRSVEIGAIARRCECSDAYVHQVIGRKRTDRFVEDVISECLGIEADRIWSRRSEAV